jgi:hypothetical protein
MNGFAVTFREPIMSGLRAIRKLHAARELQGPYPHGHFSAKPTIRQKWICKHFPDTDDPSESALQMHQCMVTVPLASRAVHGLEQLQEESISSQVPSFRAYRSAFAEGGEEKVGVQEHAVLLV